MAKTNLQLQFGLQDTPIGNERARLLLSYMGMRPGTRNGMQRNTNKAGEITSSVCQEDIREKIQNIKMVNKARGLSENTPIAAEFDVRYGGARMNSSYRPGQGASNAIGLLVENVTDGKSIIGVYVENKLCSKGAWLRKQGQDVSCPGHEGCTATISCSDLISEKKIAEEIGNHLCGVHEIMVSHLTTDSDAKGPAGMEEAMQKVEPTWRITKFKDLTHLGKSQQNAVKNAKFSDEMFREIPRAPLRHKAQEALAKDLAARCAISHKKLFEICGKNIEKIKRCAYRVVDCIVDCYSGDHRRCRSSKFAFTCKGTPGRTWFEMSHHLDGLKITSFNPSSTDKHFLRRVIHMTLGREGLAATQLRTTTQGCESRNAGLSVSLPKSRRHPRNVTARAHSAVLRLNNGPVSSMEKKLAAGGCSLPETSYAVATFKEQAHRNTYGVEYKHRPEVQKHMMTLRRRRLRQYYEGVRERVHEVEYRKFQLDRAICIKKKKRRMSKTALRRHSVRKRKPNSPAYIKARQNVKKAKRFLQNSIRKDMENKQKGAEIRAERRQWQKKDHIYAKGGKSTTCPFTSC